MDAAYKRRKLSTAEREERAGDRWLSMKDIEAETTLDRSTIYRKIEAGLLPEGTRIATTRVVWFERDVLALKHSLLAAAA